MKAPPNAARRYVLAGAAIVLLTLIGYLRFPGHTFLQSDTQIYVPILERFQDPSVFQREPLAQEPHVSFTVYDETAIALRRLTGLQFRDVLAVERNLELAPRTEHAATPLAPGDRVEVVTLVGGG